MDRVLRLGVLQMIATSTFNLFFQEQTNWESLTQCTVSSFGELQATLAEYLIVILTMSEIWLKNNSHLLS